jgi:diaminopimelate epimerase
MDLYRAHGLGNDYLVLETGEVLDAGRVRALCDRHRGVGSDGILEPVPGLEADYGVRIWNPDGSIAEKSGNGLRIFARWLVDRRGAPPQFSVWTGTDRVTCTVADEAIAVAMGTARFPGRLPSFGVSAEVREVRSVDLGNPHLVLFVDAGDLDAWPWRAWGERLEVDPAFPHRTNVQIAQVREGRLEIRIWERGAGPTLASGSSSCAAAAAAVKSGRLAPGRIAVDMPGGTLSVHVHPDFRIDLEGPVETVGVFTVDAGWWARQTQASAASPGSGRM